MTMPLQTAETLKQLDYDFWRAVRRFAKVRTEYFRKAHTEKVEPQEEVLNLLHHLDTLMKQMTVKIANNSRSVATAIADEALKNPRKIQESMAKLNRLNQIFKRLRKDAGDEKIMSSALGNVANGVGKQINDVIKNTQAQLQQIVKRGQQAEKQQQRQRFLERLRLRKSSKPKFKPAFGFGRA